MSRSIEPSSTSRVDPLLGDASAVADGRRRSRRSLIGRQGAYALHARYDSTALTRAARDKFLARFEEEVDPRRELPEQERQRRAQYARKSYMTALARKSADARARTKDAS